jgi:HD-GYP domain-containing protein (c-di-GMP phosphodiesterase class II)
VSVSAVAPILLRRSLAVPFLSGLLLLLALANFGHQEGFVRKTADLVLLAGFQRYSPDALIGQGTETVPPEGAGKGGVDVANTGTITPDAPAWAGQLSPTLAFFVWLSLSGLFILRSSLVLAGALTWCGALLTASMALLFVKGWYISPALPLLSVVLSYLFLAGLDQVWERRRHARWLHRRNDFQQRILQGLATAVEIRDPDTGGHVVRMQNYVRALTRQLSRSGIYTDVLTPEYRELLVHLCPLHDIGKAAVSDAILLKPGRLSEEEHAEMKRHVDYGQALLFAAAGKEEDEFFNLARDIVGSHHERWDGGGYPMGLRGEEIPLAGRIMAVADVYDALITKRCYKIAYSREQSRAILMKGRGTIFDPAIADAFREIEVEMWKISLTYSDTVDSSEGARP